MSGVSSRPPGAYSPAVHRRRPTPRTSSLTSEGSEKEGSDPGYESGSGSESDKGPRRAARRGRGVLSHPPASPHHLAGHLVHPRPAHGDLRGATHSAAIAVQNRQNRLAHSRADEAEEKKILALEHEVKQLELKAKVEHQLSFEEGKLEVLEREEGKERGEVEEVKEAIAKLHNHHEVASNELADEHEDKIKKATVAHKTHRANVRDAHAAFMNKHHPWST